jgi:spore coat polysaccharide biosynthesis predicted glycosyltransferase SpsG/RimJ/RimL family protein N-acetyltransferase
MGFGHAYRCLAISQALRAQGVEVQVLTWSLEGSQTEAIFCDFDVRVLGEEMFSREMLVDSDGDTWDEYTQLLDGERASKHLSSESTVLVDSYGLGVTWEHFIESLGVRIFRLVDFDTPCSQSTKQIKPFLWPSGGIGDAFTDRFPNQIMGNTVMPLAKIATGTLLASKRRQAMRSRVTPSKIVLQFGTTLEVKQVGRVLRSVLMQTINSQQDIQVIGLSDFEQRILKSNNPLTERVSFLPFTNRLENLNRVLDSDLVIGAAGVSAIERLYLGIPQLVFPIAKNQLQNTESLSTWGIPSSKTLLTETSNEHLDTLISGAIRDYRAGASSAVEGTMLMDGFGSDRVASQLIRDLGFKASLRAAEPSDAATFFLWANSQSVRVSASRANEIAPEEHRLWFTRALESEDTHITVLTVNDIPAGQCRLQACSKTDEFIMDYSVDSLYRGLGLAKQLIQGSLARHRIGYGRATYVAEVRPDNHASQGVLTALGFKRVMAAGQLLRFESTES